MSFVLSGWVSGDNELARQVFGELTGNEPRLVDQDGREWIRRTAVFDTQEEIVAAIMKFAPSEDLNGIPG